jgi:N-acetylneuraminic acid mutarotase
VDDKLYILGGSGDQDRGVLDLTQIYDPKTDTWNKGASMPYLTSRPAAGATTSLLAPKRIYVIGGGVSDFAVNNTQVYNPETDSWEMGAGDQVFVAG